MNPQNATPEVVVELTKTYLHNLTDNELQEHFIQLSNKFATSLNDSSVDELNGLQTYLRMITAEMSFRLNGLKNK